MKQIFLLLVAVVVVPFSASTLTGFDAKPFDPQPCPIARDCGLTVRMK